MLCGCFAELNAVLLEDERELWRLDEVESEMSTFNYRLVHIVEAIDEVSKVLEVMNEQAEAVSPRRKLPQVGASSRGEL